MPAALKAGASLSYPVAPSWASGRIGGGHTLSLLPVVSAGLYTNYPLRDPKYHLIDTIRPLIELEGLRLLQALNRSKVSSVAVRRPRLWVPRARHAWVQVPALYIILYYIILYYIILYYIILYYIILYYIILYYIILYYIILYYIILYYIILYYILLYYIPLYYTILYYIILYSILFYSIVLHYIILYYIVLYCIVLYCYACVWGPILDGRNSA